MASDPFELASGVQLYAMTDTAVATFAAHAEDYDAPRRRLVPPYDAFYGTAVRALELARRPIERVLDLGAGTGLLAARVLAAHPGAQVTLLDGAGAMLDRARDALGGRARYVTADLGDALPPGPWDAVVSALAIHHLDDDAKRALFERVGAALAPGGVFVDAEQVLGPTPALDAAYRAWHERAARALGTTDAEWSASLERQAHDRCATVEDQLAWLRGAGFADADCLFKDGRFAVLAAVRPGASEPA
jgi:tRNA (cmo5U34)-methyltransferase